MKIYKIYYYIFLTLITSARIYCQSGNSGVAGNIFNLPYKNFTENLNIKTDKDIYVAGEKIWFRIWSFDNFYNKPLALSKIGYIELLDSRNTSVLRQEVSFDNSSLNNALAIPDTLSSENYIIRVYTQWMRNFDPEYYCYKTVQIINPLKNIRILTGSIADTIKHPTKIIDRVESGINLQIRDFADSIIIDISGTVLNSGSKEVTVISFGGVKVLNLGTVNLQNSHQINVLKRRLPEGSSELLLCGKNGNFLSRSVIYIQPRKRYSVSIVSNDTIFRTRNKVIIDLQAGTTENEYLTSDLSVSVTRRIPVSPDKISGISDNKSLAEESSKRSWVESAILDSGKYNFSPEIYGKRITGRVFTNGPKKPAGNIPLCLSFPGKDFQSWFTLSEPDGRFAFTLNEYFDKNDILLTSGSKSLSNLLFEIDDPFSKQFSNRKTNPFFFDKSLMQYIEKAGINMQINKGKEINPYTTDDKKSRTCFYGKPDKVFQLDKYIKIPTVGELISDLLPMVSTRKIDNKIQIAISGISDYKKYVDILGYNPLLLIDGVPVLNSELFLETNTADIERIEIIYSIYYFGSIRFDGILNLITKNGTCNINLGSEATRMTYHFMEPERKFNAPDYSNPVLYNSRTPDFRTTLYWNPQVIPDKNGKARLEFYTSDDTGDYIIDVEGYTNTGIRIKETSNITVKN